MAVETLRSICRMCHGGCGVIVRVQDGRVAEVVGDRENPNNTGFLCTKGRAAPELVHHPDRLVEPMARVGPRGSRRFAPIGWDEALDRIADAMRQAIATGGPESIVLAQGTDRNFQEWTFRFANALGTPNVLGPAHICFYPRVMAAIFTLGDITFCDYEGDPDVVVVWGSNKAVTHGDGVIGVRLLKALSRRAGLVVIDPRRTALAARADYWLRPRPGTDLALALGLLNVVLAEGLHDAPFVAEYTVGFEALRGHVGGYDPDRVAAWTGIPSRAIEEVARYYARAPAAAIEAGTGLEQNRNSFQCLRAINLLAAVCGNLDRPGGNVIWEPTGILGRRTFPRSESLPEDQARKRLGGDAHRILSLAGWAHPGAVWRAILAADPYPVQTMLVLGSNPVTTYADSETVHRALSLVPFLAVGDLFPTPTTDLADVVLPIAGWLERDQIVEHAHYLAPRRRAVQVGQCRSDEEVLTGLAHRLGLGEAFWSRAEEALDARLAPIGLTWHDLVAEAYRANRLEYYKYRSVGFRTRSGKVNLVAEGLARMGYDALPTYKPIVSESPEPSTYLLTSRHSPHFFNSEFRQVARLRGLEPEPTLEIHPRDAAREAIGDGDGVALVIGDREAWFRARLTDETPAGVVYAPASWWYPELPHGEDWRRSNLNRLTTETTAADEMGSSDLRGIRCRLRRIAGPERP